MWTKSKKLDDLIEEVKILREDKEELINILRGLFVPIGKLTNAFASGSPYGKAAEVLEKHGRYWR